MGVVFGRVLGWVGRCLVSIFSWRLEWGTEFDLGMIVGEGTNSWEFLFLCCATVPQIRMLQRSLCWWGQFEGERQSWDVRFFQRFNDWELGLVAAFLHLLDSHIPLHEDGDRRLKKNEEFDICSFYNALRGSNSVTFPWKCIWGVKAPQRVSLLIWTTALGKILTCYKLRKRSYTIEDWCCMCQCSREAVDHLLPHCK